MWIQSTLYSCKLLENYLVPNQLRNCKYNSFPFDLTTIWFPFLFVVYINMTRNMGLVTDLFNLSLWLWLKKCKSAQQRRWAERCNVLIAVQPKLGFALALSWVIELLNELSWVLELLIELSWLLELLSELSWVIQLRNSTKKW